LLRPRPTKNSPLTLNEGPLYSAFHSIDSRIGVPRARQGLLGECNHLVRDGVSGARSAFVKQEMRVMRIRYSWLLVLSALLLAPLRAHAQNYEVPPSPLPYTGMLSHPRYEQGGFFT